MIFLSSVPNIKSTCLNFKFKNFIYNFCSGGGSGGVSAAKKA